MERCEECGAGDEAGEGTEGWIEGCDAVTRSVEDLNVLFEFAKEGEATEEEVDAHYAETVRLVENLELKNMLQERRTR